MAAGLTRRDEGRGPMPHAFSIVSAVSRTVLSCRSGSGAGWQHQGSWRPPRPNAYRWTALLSISRFVSAVETVLPLMKGMGHWRLIPLLNGPLELSPAASTSPLRSGLGEIHAAMARRRHSVPWELCTSPRLAHTVLPPRSIY